MSLLAACTRNPASPGVRDDATGSAILVAATMPACDCLSLANTRDEAGGLKPTDSGGIEVVASLDGKVTGSMILDSRQAHTEKFDWASSQASHRYQIVAYARRAGGSRGNRLRPISRYVRVAQRGSHPCEEPVCAFGPLALSAAVHARAPTSR